MSKRIHLLTGSTLAALILMAATMSGVASARELVAAGDVNSPAAPQEQVLGAVSLPATLPAGDLPAGPEVALEPMEAQLLDLLNGERIARGLAPLELDSRLEDLARQRSADMAGRNYFSHYTPEGTMVFDQMNAQGIPFRFAGENLAKNHESPENSAQVAHDGFMNSPTHAQNDLEPTFNKVGIGVAVAEGGFVYFTELFAALD